MDARVASDEARLAVASLLGALQAGEPVEEAFRRLFRLYHGPVHDFFARRGFSPQDCQDLTQETFLGTYRSMGSFRGEAPFEAWLFAIAANVYRKRLRALGTGLRQGIEVPIETAGGEATAADARELTDPASGPAEDALDRERSRQLREAVARLPPQMRACLVLRVYRDLKYREVAAALRLSIDTVKAHLFQARQRLKQELGEQA